MGADAASQLQGATFEKRCAWILDKKEEGNVEFKSGNYQVAMDKYLASLCGFDFKKTLEKEKRHEVDKTLKVPILNNLASCLMKMKKFQRGIDMLDQSLKIDSRNEKANLRKVQCHIELGDHERANNVLKVLDDIAFQSPDSQVLYKEIKRLKSLMTKTSKSEKQFA